jgi:hypothetical protein
MVMVSPLLGRCHHLTRSSCRRRPDDYFRFNPPQGLGDLNLADYMSEGLIVEITNVWLRTPDGKECAFAAYEKLQVSLCYKYFRGPLTDCQ